jgi:hypothetical protein
MLALPTMGKVKLPSNSIPGTTNLFRRLVSNRIPELDISVTRK